MDKPRPKWRISLRAALLAMLGLGAGIGLIRGALVSGNPGLLFPGALFLAGTGGALVAIAIGHHPIYGIMWALFIVCGCMLVMLLSVVR